MRSIGKIRYWNEVRVNSNDRRADVAWHPEGVLDADHTTGYNEGIRSSGVLFIFNDRESDFPC